MSVSVVWEPLPGSQRLALSARHNEILYCGTRAGGKSELQLAYFRQFVGTGYGEFLRGVVFDREYKSLDDLVAKSKRLFKKFNDGSKFLASLSAYKWVWPTGEELLFRAAENPDDYWSYHGQEFPIILWNELCKYPTPELYLNMFSVCRSSFNGEQKIPLTVFSTTNSKGPGKAWVKKRFITGREYGETYTETSEEFNPKTKQIEPISRSRVALFSTYKENHYLDASYIAGIKQSITDENTRKSWLEGSWDINDGGAFEGLWDDNIHVIDRFKIPAQWRVDRAFDWGSSQPFATLWFAQANGEAAENGFCPPAGTLILFHEYYGSHPDNWGENKGLKLSPTEVSKGIIAHEHVIHSCGIYSGKIYPGPADNSIGNEITVEDDSIEKKMAKQGITWTKSNKSPGSRRIGLQLFRDRLTASVKKEGSGFYITRNCKAVLTLLPILPLDPKNPDDIDTKAEDHVWDAIRYRCLKGDDEYSRDLKISQWF